MIKLFLPVCFSILAYHAGSQTNAQSKKVNRAVVDTNFSKLSMVALPRPNSETYSFEQAGKRKQEIYDLQPTKKYFSWKNPTTGGAVHINKRDEIEVYQFTFGILESVTDSAVNYIDAPKDSLVVIKNPTQLPYYVGGIGEGNAATVLITSEISLYKSQAIKRILEALWQPSIQLYYLKKVK